MTCEISVITCSHNPRPDYLKQVLDALNEQTLDQQRWEYLLIDNASDDPIESRVDLSWHQSARHVREEKLGLTHARLRGLNEAHGEILVFVDDDNVLDADFLEQTLEIAKKWPKLGSWSGETRASFEKPAPEWTKRYWGHLVIRSVERDKWSNVPHLPETMPNGAGLCVRRSVADHYVYLHASGMRRFILDRVGTSLISGGDNDLAACACDVGLGVGVFQSLKLVHLIPASRLEEGYLLRLVEGIEYSGIIFRSFRSPDIFSLQRRWPGIFADLLRQTLMNSRQRRFFRAARRGELQAFRYLGEMKKKQIEVSQKQPTLHEGVPILKDT